MIYELGAASGGWLLHASCVRGTTHAARGREGAHGRVETGLRRRGAEMPETATPQHRPPGWGLVAGLAIVLLLAEASCAPALDFRTYRACVERAGSNLHDPGTVLWEELGDDGLRHYGVLYDRRRDDPRQVVDLAAAAGVRINRTCPLVTGVSIGGRPIGIEEAHQ